MKDNANRLEQRLKNVGLTDSAIKAAWPIWWSEAADASVSAQTELRFSLARKLGLDPRSLLEDNEAPRFVWREEARFKHLKNEKPLELSAITSFGTALSRYLVEAIAPSSTIPELSSVRLRNAILSNQPFVRLVDLLSVCWAFAIPVIHLRIFPCARKRMAAMTVRVDHRTAILVGRDSMFPPHIAFYIAHELGHIALGHLSHSPIVVDLDKPNLASNNNDQEEDDADRFALEVLTGESQPSVLPSGSHYNARELARVAINVARELAIEPGMLALCFGFSTKNWRTANGAMRQIYRDPKPVWAEINSVASNQLDFSVMPEDATTYVKAVLGDKN